MRHGEAQQVIDSQMTDAKRSLTQQGQLEANLMGQWLSNMQVELDQVFVSPYLRAQQTCNTVLSTMKASDKATTGMANLQATTLDFITPMGDAKQVRDYLDGLFAGLDSHQQSLLMVAHMPLVSYLVAELTQSENAPIFATAAIAHIDYDVEAMSGELIRLVSPLDLC